MAGPVVIRDAFAALAAAVEGIATALPYEPERLPARFPAVTMVFTNFTQEDVYTGPATVNEWMFRVRVHVALKIGPGSDFARAYGELEVLVPRILRIVRTNPGLNGSCEWARIEDVGEEPLIATDNRAMAKDLRLIARTEVT